MTKQEDEETTVTFTRIGPGIKRKPVTMTVAQFDRASKKILRDLAKKKAQRQEGKMSVDAQEVNLSIQTCHNGRPMESFNAELEKATRDVIARSSVDKRRKVILTIALTPNIDVATGEIGTKIEWETKAQIPGNVGVSLDGRVKNGQIVVPYSGPDVSIQGALFEQEKE